MKLNMMCIDVNLPLLYSWGRTTRTGRDRGYLLHAALRAIFGSQGPQPFFFDEERSRVLGYTESDEDTLRNCLAKMQEQKTPEQAEKHRILQRAFLLPEICLKTMPETWQRGQRFRYETFCTPTRRVDRRESDAWLLAAARLYREAKETGSFFGTEQNFRRQHSHLREEVYRLWMKEQIERGGGAVMEECFLRGYRTVNPIMRRQSGHHGAPTKGEHRNFPEITACGVLSVSDPEAFSALLRRGIGRHRAFGYGMLLLRGSA